MGIKFILVALVAICLGFGAFAKELTARDYVQINFRPGGADCNQSWYVRNANRDRSIRVTVQFWDTSVLNGG